MVRITINGVRSQFSSKLLVQPDQWDNKLERVKGYTAEARNLNRAIDNIRAKITTNRNKLMEIDGYVTSERLRNILLGKEEQEKTIISYFDKFIEQYKLKVGALATHKTYPNFHSISPIFFP